MLSTNLEHEIYTDLITERSIYFCQATAFKVNQPYPLPKITSVILPYQMDGHQHHIDLAFGI